MLLGIPYIASPAQFLEIIPKVDVLIGRSHGCWLLAKEKMLNAYKGTLFVSVFLIFLFLCVYWFVPIDLRNFLEARHSLLAMQNEAKRTD